jgi:hypothetical protein
LSHGKGSPVENFCRAREQEAGEEFVVAGEPEPRAFDVKEPETGNEARQRECVDHELGNGFVGARIGLVVKDVDRAVADLQEVDVPGDVARTVILTDSSMFSRITKSR